MLRNLVTSLFVHERVTTTDAKAKELRGVAERLVTKAGRISDLSARNPGDLSQSERAKIVHARRVASKHVRGWSIDRDENEVDVLWKLFTVLGPRFVDRPGGYTRIVKLPKLRKGDGAPMSIIEFVDYEEAMEAAGGDDGAAGDGEKKKGLLGRILGGGSKNSDTE